MYVVPGSASRGIADHLVRELSASEADVEIRRFIDGECYVRIKSDLRGEDVVIVQNTYPDENIIEALLLLSATKDMEPNSVTLVVPYFGYARQDRKFQDGEAVSAKVMAEILGNYADLVVLVDPHKEYITDFFGTKAISCSAIPEIARYMERMNIDVVIAPDKGAVDRARRLSELLGCESDYLEKTRLDDEVVEIKPGSIDVKDKVVAIIDDIISTGGTMARAVEEMVRQGAKEIHVACTHGLFIGEAIEKILGSGAREIISTDTIENAYSKVRVAPQIASVLRESIPKLKYL